MKRVVFPVALTPITPVIYPNFNSIFSPLKSKSNPEKDFFKFSKRTTGVSLYCNRVPYFSSTAFKIQKSNNGIVSLEKHCKLLPVPLKLKTPFSPVHFVLHCIRQLMLNVKFYHFRRSGNGRRCSLLCRVVFVEAALQHLV